MMICLTFRTSVDVKVDTSHALGHYETLAKLLLLSFLETSFILFYNKYSIFILFINFVIKPPISSLTLDRQLLFHFSFSL